MQRNTLKYWQFSLVSYSYDPCVAETYGTGKNALCVLLNWFQSVYGTCVSLSHLSAYQSICVTEVKGLAWMMRYSFIHTLIWGSCLNKQSHTLCRVYQSGISVFLAFSRCWTVASIHPLVHSHIHKIFWAGFFPTWIRAGQQFVVST